ncbi:hypothetical protein BDZ90DRAFT_133903 [Jaminaea rosea]|uniref:Uncharacterized protein n=1 Tax=Jaminaea rosea TaxID=1569628 RepID=A0A316UUD9_9BASI|nr:hypothetical protein BDZ90DRAFT_133903 [Jaminaea rosea]PWN28899.1 hypothetical protein BDZ90DRAFT_133903 [Jaminaea rosea]
MTLNKTLAAPTAGLFIPPIMLLSFVLNCPSPGPQIPISDHADHQDVTVTLYYLELFDLSQLSISTQHRAGQNSTLVPVWRSGMKFVAESEGEEAGQQFRATM